MNDTSKAEQRNALMVKAREVRLKAYAPYSDFQVGAALVADDGQVYVGCNVENAAYPEGTCAEAGAIAAMIAGGGRRIAMIAVVAGGERMVSPCGGCRQKLAEFCDASVEVHLSGPDKGSEEVSYTVAELLPASFAI